jgi:FtsH-binding integral membrane protein
MSYAMEYPIAARAGASARAAFIRRTYAHLAGAVLAFAALEFLFFAIGLPEMMLQSLVASGSPILMLVLVGAFIGVGFLARMWAYSAVGPGLQYAGLALYVIFEAIIFMPILYVANTYPAFQGQHLIETAGILTLCVFAGLTASVFITRADFSFLGPILMVASFILLGVIIAAIFFPPMNGLLGLGFSFIMVALMAGYILYDTSNVIHHFRTDQHVAASLELFADVALLFYYILRILMMLNSNNR